MAVGMINAGLSGVYAAQAGLTTTGHNIANASTPGFNRQVVQQTEATPLGTGSGFLGQGTQISTVTRQYNQFLSNQLVSAQADSSQLSAYYDQVQKIDNLLAGTNSGLSPALQGFFNGVQTAANNPANTTSRQALLSAGDALTAGFNSLDQQLTQIASGVNDQISNSVASINADAQQIAQLNQKIVVAQSSTGGQPANDLLDQRDALLSDLNKLIKTTVIQQPDGTSNVFVGSGQALVLNSTSFALSTVSSATNPMRLELAYTSPGGPQPLPDSSIQGGSLGGVLAFRSGSLDSARNTLGRIAVTLADTFNQQHQLGQDASGAPGGTFFNVAGPQVTDSSQNTSTATIAATLANSNALTTSDYQLTFDGANYTLTRLSDGNQHGFAGFPQTIDGVTLSLASGVAKAGDEFLIQPTVAGAGSISMAITDPAKVALAAPIVTASASGNTGAASISAGVVNGPPPVNANLQQPVTITFTSPTTYSVSGTGTGNPAGVAYSSGGNISYNGWTVQITGNPGAGDSFTVGPNSFGVADNRNALLLGKLQSANLIGNSSLSYQSAYANMVGTVGNKTQELSVTSAAQTTLVNQSSAALQSFSGVNLDEEAANLMRYQQAYQASAKVIATAAKLFDSILQLG